MEKTLKEIAEELFKIKGNVKGDVLRNTFLYINEKEGAQGVSAIEKRLEEIGYPLKFKEIDRNAWYPEAFSVLLLITSKDVFGWQDSDIFAVGNSAIRYSSIIKIMVRHFVSIENVLKQAPILWRKHLDFGKLEIVDFNKEKRYAKIAVKGHKFHEVSCRYFAGYFQGAAQLCVKSENITAKETKCVFKGDSCHEFLINW
jgi:hypothetical protein